MPEPDWNRIAAGAYEAYSQVIRAEQQTLAVPEWEDLPPRHHDAWKEAVHSVERALTEESNT